MIPTLNPVTTGQSVPVMDFLDAASTAGFPAIEYSITPFYQFAQEKSIDYVKQLLLSKKLEIGSFQLPVEFRLDEETFTRDLAKLGAMAAFARELGVTRCCTWLFPATDEPVAEYTCRFVRRLRECAKILGEYGIRFGIEWVGPKTLRATKKYEFIHTIPGALDLIGAIGESNVGLLFDSFHWYTSGATTKDIEALTADQIVLVHINDAPDKPADEQIDNQRLLPGEGIIDLSGMLTSLRKIGYDSYLSIETFSDELPLLGADQAALKTKQAVDHVLSGIFSKNG
jgi:sugar phosphate isomerase/epimerase